MTEQISALLDDELALEDAEHLMAGMQTNGYAGEAWSQYHLIGDVMRGANSLSPNFKQNLMSFIDLEPTVLSPNAAGTNEPNFLNEINDANVFRAKKSVTNVSSLWSVAASCAAVTVVGWMVLQSQFGPQGATNMVVQVPIPQQVAKMTVTNEQNVPAEYLMAHQASAPSASSYYIQSASFTE